MRAKEKINTIDFYLLQRELISNIRGEESQVDLSKNLGYSFNKIAKWESATNKISWNDFLAICSCKDIFLKTYFKDKFNYSDSLIDSSTLIFYMVGSIPLNELASTLQISRAKAYRLLSEDNKHYLEDILKILCLVDPGFINFISILTKGVPLTSLAHLHDDQALENVFFTYPEAALVIRCLELSEYKEQAFHDSWFFTKKLGLDLQVVEHLIKILEDNSMIGREDDGKYKVLSKVVVFNDKHHVWKDKAYWMTRLSKLIQERSDNHDINSDRGKFICAVTTVTPEAKKLVEDRVTQTFHEIYAILSSEVNTPSSKMQVKSDDVCLVYTGLVSMLKDND